MKMKRLSMVALLALVGGLTLSAQAVGGATGRNPIPVIIPCHRVIGADGSLTVTLPADALRAYTLVRVRK